MREKILNVARVYVVKRKKIIVFFVVILMSTTQTHADFGSWLRDLFTVKPIDKSKYELTKRGYRLKKKAEPEVVEEVEEAKESKESSEQKVFLNDGNPFAINMPPFRAPVGSIWVRNGDTWNIVTSEDFIEEKQSEVRDSYSDVLGSKFPIKKSIFVYNVDNGQETMLRSNEDYSIQVSGYGPRGSIRVNVFNKDGEQLPGDFITIAKNVEDGTASAMAVKALSAIEEIQKAGDITPFCRTDKDFGVISDIETDNDNSLAPVASPLPRMRPIETDDYHVGCEALADGVSKSDSARLKVCVNSLMSHINAAGGNMCSKLQRIFGLNEQEQDFIGMLMATKAEAPGGLSGGAPDHLMIMKSLDNRVAAGKRRGWSEPLAITDIAFQPMQYSAFNDSNGDNRFDAPGFLTNQGYDKLVDSFVEYHHAEWKPPGAIDNVTHYYSPPAMVPRNSVPRWVTGGIRRNGAREITNEIRVNGKPVVNAGNSRFGYHKFYVGIDGRNNYNATRVSRRRITNQCN